ncbi:MAG: 30S ribosomal protein S19 [Candidatus Buchananbacteria bacterium RIFCSPHIGHO2_01_FULL_39_14]|uniref:Small ribosomal subunit protein uS19 n=2 Tax=Candidatus Buchananiibacteriota TaxID=1817903 RepID=A0A1G1YLU0_9BACT|nr:MAG: 30S ribosomal protein S19 [Candidatus Buchananbacteria bacterium RIFCSPHIGHO2_01_FULL_39_14]OGY49334.1 MAG: 30S ribosomal protein S19 [Candidatus Buchananbacteria bacterium RIFCSPHIGHO2_02_FULL_39_17]OGY53328.1 MAG: 30S ribosomal protein S19 [Candidatus Buchananbacteria bacterium RIFCSPLOWO2_01_FULL_40_23b]
MSRSLKKGPYVNEKLLKKLQRLKAGDKTVVKTWDRASMITPEMVGYTIGVHNGRIHIPVLIVEDMVGHRLGEFAQTRKFVIHGGRMAKEEQKVASDKAAEERQKAQAAAEKK